MRLRGEPVVPFLPLWGWGGEQGSAWQDGGAEGSGPPPCWGVEWGARTSQVGRGALQPGATLRD